MSGGGPALVRLRDGRTYAASSHSFRGGRVFAVCRRFVKVGPGNERTSFHGELRARSWPRGDVREVRAVDGSGSVPEGASGAETARDAS